MVPDIRRITDKESSSGDGGESDLPIVVNNQGQSICHTERSGICTQQEGSQRIGLNRNQFGAGKRLSSG